MADDGDEAAEEDGEGAPAFEPGGGEVEVVFVDEEEAADLHDEGFAAEAAEVVGDEGAEEAAGGGGEDGGGPGEVGVGGGEGAAEGGHDEFGGDGGDHGFEGHEAGGDPEAVGGVDGVGGPLVDDFEHGDLGKGGTI